MTELEKQEEQVSDGENLGVEETADRSGSDGNIPDPDKYFLHEDSGKWIRKYKKNGKLRNLY